MKYNFTKFLFSIAIVFVALYPMKKVAAGSMDYCHTTMFVNSDSLDVFAKAICGTSDRNMYMVQIDSVRRTTSGLVSADITVAGVTMTVGAGGPAVMFGPFTHSGIGGAVQVGLAKNGLDSCFFDVAETLCGYGNDTTYCDCPISNTLTQPAGVILAQSEPGTFMSGGSTGFVQQYILVDNATQTILDVNATGLFAGLENMAYQVFAINYPVDEGLQLEPYLTTGQDIDVFINGLAGSGVLTSVCFDFCGPASYNVACTGPALNAITLMECPKVINGMQGLFTLDDALNSSAPSNMSMMSIVPAGFTGIVSYHLDSLSATQGVAALSDSNFLSLNGTVWARYKDTTALSPLIGFCCASVIEITLMVKTSPIVADTMIMACEAIVGNGSATIELPDTISGLLVTSYYPTLLMAADSMMAGLAPGNHNLNDTVLYARVIDSVGCPAVSEVTVLVKDIPIVSAVSPIELCPVTNVPTINLFSSPDDPLNTTFSYRVIDPSNIINLADNSTGTVGPMANPALPAITTSTNIGTAIIRVAAEQNGCLGDSIDIMITTNGGFGITFLGCPIATIMKSNDMDSCGAVVEWTPPTAISDCSTPLTPIRDLGIGNGLMSGDLFPIGNDTIRYIVTDGAGNIDTCEFYIMVMDTQDPVVNCPADTLLFATSSSCTSPLNVDPLIGLNENCMADTSYTITFADGSQTTGSGLPDSQNYQVGLNTVCIELSESGDRMTPTGCVGDPGGPVTLTYDFTANSLAAVSSDMMLANGLDYSASGDVGALTFPAGNPSPSASTNGWSNSSSFVASEFTELSIVAPACFDLTVSTISFDTRRSGTGPQQMGISIDGSTSLDFTAAVPSGSSFSPHTYNPTSTLTVPAGTTQSVRFHGWATSNTSGSGTFRFDNIIVSIMATPIPSMPVASSSGVSTECCFSITVVDTVKPTFTCPADTTVDGCAGRIPDLVSGLFGSDNCGTPVVFTQSPAPGVNFGINFNDSINVVITAMDVNGNYDTCSVKVTIDDNDNPYFQNCPTDLTVCNDIDQCSAIVNFSTPVAFDNCDDSLTVTQTRGMASGSAFIVGMPDTIEFTATDDNGNSITCEFVINVEDCQKPDAVCQDIVVYLDATGMVSIEASDVDGGSSDNCEIDTIVISTTDFSCLPPVTVVVPPVLGGDLVISGIMDGPLTGGHPKAIQFYAQVDIPDMSIYGFGNANNGGGSDGEEFTFPGGSVTAGTYIWVTANATGFMDWFGFSADHVSSHATINGDDPIDLFKNGAAIDMYGDVALDGTGEPWEYTDGWASRDITALGTTTWNMGDWTLSGIDALDGQTSNAASASMFPIVLPSVSGAGTAGFNLVTLTVTDTAGNVDSCVATVTVLDTIAPTFTCPSDMTVSGCSGTVPDLIAGLTGMDNCGLVTFTQNPLPGVTFGPNANDSLFVIITATDGSGNTDTCSVELTIIDGTNPYFQNCPSDLTVCNDIDQCSAIVNFSTPVAFDNCDDSLTVTQTRGMVSGSTFIVGMPDTIEFTATDDDGNNITCSFIINVEDCQSPEAECQDIAVYLNASGAATIVAGDIDGGSDDNCMLQTIVASQTAFDCSHLGLNQVTLTVTDTSGNVDSCVATVTIIDTLAPMFTCPADLTVSGCSGTVPDLIAGLTGTDNCGLVTFTQNPLPGVTFGPNANDSLFVIITAIDGSGNTDTCSVELTIIDGTNPYFQNCPSDLTVCNDIDQCSAIVNFSTPVAFDNCDDSLMVTQTRGMVSGSTFIVGMPDTIEFTATDDDGNNITCSFIINVEDCQSPEAECQDIVVYLDATGMVSIEASDVDGGSSDNCEIDTIVISTTDFSCLPPVTVVVPPVLGGDLVISGIMDGPLTGGHPKAIQFYAQVDIPDMSIYGFGNANNGGGSDGEEFTFPGGSVTAGTYIWVTANATGFMDWFGFSADHVSSHATINGDDPIDLFKNGAAIDMYGDVALDGTGEPWEYTDGWASRDITALGTTTWNMGDWTLSGIDALDGQTSNAASASMFPIVLPSVSGAGTAGFNLVTLTVTDTAGNVDSCVATVTVLDTIAPTFTCPSDMTVSGCSGTVPDLIAGLTGMDNCGLVTFTQNPLPGVTFGPNANDSLFVIITATDGSGNTDTCSVELTIIDGTNPYFQNCPSDLTVCNDIDQCSAIVNFSTPVAFDNCDDSLTVTQTRGMVSGSTFIVGMPDTIEFTATDDDGNNITCSFIINVEDCQSPEAECQDIAVYLNVSGAATIVAGDIDGGSDDNCMLQTIVASQTAFDCSHLGLNQVTLTVTDTSGNVDSCVATVTIIDTLAPMFTCPADLTVSGCSGTVPDLIAGLTGTDNCGLVTFTQNPLPGVTFGPNANDSLFVIITATDGSGNTDTCSVELTIIDGDNPYFQNCPSDLTVCNDIDQCSAIVNFSTPVAFDNCDDSLTVTQTRGMVSGSTFIVGMPDTIEFTATDDDNNVITCSFIINVTDCQAPEAECQDIAVYLNASGAATIVAANIDGGSDDNCMLQSIVASQTAFDCSDLGLNQVTLTVTDTSGNVDSCVATVTILDTLAPMFTCPADMTVSGCSGTVPDLIAGLTGMDNCGLVTFTQNPLPGVTFGPNANDSLFVIITATDGSGNTDTCSVELTIIDGTNPYFQNCPTDLTVCNDIDQCSAIVNFSTPVAFDNCDDSLMVTQTRGMVSGSTFIVGMPDTIEFMATDDDGNNITCSFIINVEDCQSPEAECQDIAVYLNASGAATIVAGDIDGGSDDNCMLQTIVASQTAFDCSHLGLNQVILTVTDTSGNVDSCVATVTIIDTLAPMFTCPADLTVSGCSGTVPDLIAGLTGTDNCGLVTFTQSPLPGVTFGPNANDSLNVIITAMDGSGNIDTCAVKLTIIDNGLPVFTNCPDTIRVCNDTDLCGAKVNWFDPTAVDNCDDTLTVVQTVGDPSGSLFPFGLTNITYSATDDNGNTVTCDFVIMVMDCQIPTPICRDIEVYLDASGQATIIPMDIDGGSHDNCDTVMLTISHSDFDCSHLGLNNITLTVADTSGNLDSCISSVTVIDTIVPTFVCPADVSIGGCSGTVPNLINGLIGQDNCGGLVTFTQNPLPGVTFGPNANDTINVVITAMDGSGNIDTCAVKVTIVDDGVPVFVNCPDTISSCNDVDQCGANVNWFLPIAIDNCDDTLAVSLTAGLPSGSFFPVGTTVIQYTATDDDGNSSTCDFVVIVSDCQMPTAVCKDIFLNVDGNCEVTIMADAIDGGSTDNCAIDTMLISRDGVLFTDMITFMVADLADPFVHVTLQLTDLAGNVSECIATVTVLDTMAPNVICQDDITINTEPGTCYGKLPNIIPPLDTMENCLPLAYFDQYPEPGLLFGSHHGDSLQVFVVATDMDGNKDTCSLFVHLNDNEPPMFTNCPRPQIIVKAMPGMCGAFVNFSLPVATDNCQIDTTYQSDNTGLTSGDMFPAGKTIIEWVTFDVAGNMDSCTLEVIVNDEQDPTIVCPDDITVVSDPGICGATVDSISLDTVFDNCLTAVTYQILDENGLVSSTGVEDASNSEFGCGENTVNYMVSDQPILLISEVSQDISAVIGGTVPVPGFIQPTAGNDYVEVTNFGPADFDLSCLIVERIYVGGHDTLEVPARTILPVGDVLTVHFGTGINDPSNFFFNDMEAIDVPTATPAAYIISFAGRVIDVVAVNGFDPTSVIGIAPISSPDWDIAVSIDISSNGGASRISAWDTNSSGDFRLNDACHIGTVGTINPELPIMNSIGSVVALQTLAENTASCSFTVTIVDEELPHCGTAESHVFTGGTNMGDAIVGGSVMSSSFNVTDNYLIADVNVLNINGTHPDVGDLVFKLTAPSGTEVTLGRELCDMSGDFDFGLDSDSTIEISSAPCAPLGQGGLYIPQESLDVFIGEMSFGTWTLAIADMSPANSGVFNSWTLELMSQEPYAQQDTTLVNDFALCSAEFTWVSPELFDNCLTGQMTVSYETTDDIDLPLGGTITPGTYMTEIFDVGVTTVTYTLTDKMGNESSCSFDVTVLDTEAPTVSCPQDLTVALSSGDCDGMVYFDLNAVDNCAVDSFLATPASGSAFPIGTNVVEIIAFDASGNSDTCYFNIEVIPFNPANFDLTCKGKVNLSLGPDCEAAITADLLLVGDNHTCYEDYCFSIEDTLGNVVTDTVFNLSHVGNCYNVSIFLCEDPSITCWGVICVEKKSTPDFVCPVDTILPCNVFADTAVTGTPYITSCETGYAVSYSDTYEEFDICDTIIKKITRVWTVTNDQGFSNTCTQLIEVRKFNLNMVQFPPDFIGNLAFECSDVANDPSLTTTANTGEPMIDFKSIYGDHYCEVDVGYWDEHLTDANCPSAYTILRNWIVLDECLPTSATNPRRHIQRIKVADRLAPETICPDDITINTDVNFCYGSTILELPNIDDGCSPISNTKIEVSSGALYQIGPDEWILSNLIQGTHTVTFRVTDGCRNRTTCSYNITVIDDIPPVPTCDATTRVSLGSNGLAEICWETFDDFGYDNCGIERIQVRRVERGDCFGYNSNDRDWKDCEEFCCEDIDEDVLIEVGYWDYSGNFNYCWVTVIVEDKLPPAIVAPPDITISCDFKFDLNNLDIFGKIASEVDYVVGSNFTVLRTDNDLREEVTIDDPDYYYCLYGTGYAGDKDPINWGIDGWAVDNCSIELTYTDNIDMECGRSREINGIYLPAITRRWTATPKGDVHNNGAQTAVQRIYIQDCDPFFICDTEPKCAPLSSDCGVTGHTLADDVEWPCDIFIQDCPTNVDYPSPEQLVNNPAFVQYASNAYPIYEDDKCSIVADSFYDEVFEVEDACFKILRHWSIIDWCQYDENTGEGRWDYTQVLKVTDNQPPVITMDGPGCDSTATDCYSSVNLIPLVTDCTPQDQLEYWFRLDVDNDGTYDHEGFNLGDLENLPNLPYGIHRILWVIEDRCGNRATKELEFETEDCKKPSPVCIDGLSSVIMPATGEIEIWAGDWDASSFDNCDTDLEFRIWWAGMDSADYTYGDYKRPNPQSSGSDVLNNLPASAFFNCDYMQNQVAATFTVEIYAIDDNGNWDYCTSFITITDETHVCVIVAQPIVSGVVLDKTNQPIELSQVTLTPEQSAARTTIVNEQGRYSFNIVANNDYSLDAVRNDDHLNGVTAQDLSVIQRHIANIERMSSDYDKLASDANRDGKINVLDILALRKLLLGDYLELPQNTSWVMVPARYTFPGISDLQLPDNIYDQTGITLSSVSNSTYDNDFIGVKIGDVDGDAIPNSSVKSIDRKEEQPLRLNMINQSFEKGEMVEIPVTADNFIELTAYQTTFGFDVDKLEFAGLVADSDMTDHSGYGTAFIDRGLLSFVYYHTEPQTVDKATILFTLRFKALENGELKGNLTLNSKVSNSLVFSNLDRKSIELVIRDRVRDSSSFALYQNTPNPFKGITTIGFNLPENKEITFSIFDSEGTLLMQITEERDVGYNEFLVKSKDLHSAGVYFYEVKTDNNQAMKRMILIE